MSRTPPEEHYNYLRRKIEKGTTSATDNAMFHIGIIGDEAVSEQQSRGGLGKAREAWQDGNKPPPEQIVRTLHRVSAEHPDFNVGQVLKELAGDLGYEHSPKSLGDLIRRETGRTLKQHLRKK